MSQTLILPHRGAARIGRSSTFCAWVRRCFLCSSGIPKDLCSSAFQDIAQAGLGTKAFYFLTGIHREGVAIFFAVSGFLVGGGVWRSLRRSRFDAKVYFASRFARIYVVLLPALVLTLLLDRIGRSYLIDTRFFGERPLMPIGLTSDWTWGQLRLQCRGGAGNFLQAARGKSAALVARL